MPVTKEVAILIAEDDAGHAVLIEKNLRRVGLHNPIQRFEDGQAILDFLFLQGEGAVQVPRISAGKIYRCWMSLYRIS